MHVHVHDATYLPSAAGLQATTRGSDEWGAIFMSSLNRAGVKTDFIHGAEAGSTGKRHNRLMHSRLPWSTSRGVPHHGAHGMHIGRRINIPPHPTTGSTSGICGMR